MKSFMFIIGTAALLSSCAKAPEAVDVEDLNKQFITAWNNKEVDKTMGFLAEDVQFLQGNAHFSGKGEVGDKWVRATNGTISNLKTSVVSSGTDAKLAYAAGTFSVDVLPESPGQPTAFGEGNYILVWKQVGEGKDAGWKLSYAQLEDHPLRRK
jgi:ketosteroid isomerase-like protein